QADRGGPPTPDEDRHRLVWFNECADAAACRSAARDNGRVRPHADEVEAVDEIVEDLHLTSEAGIPPARLRRRVAESAIFEAGGKRIIEMVEEPAARDHEVPRLHA